MRIRSSWRRRDGALRYAASRMKLRGRERVSVRLQLCSFISSWGGKWFHCVCEQTDIYFLFVSRSCNEMAAKDPQNIILLVFFLSGRRTNTISATPKDSTTDFPEMESSYSQCSPCWSDEQPSPPQLFCRRSSADLPLPRGNSLSHAPLHASNNSALHGHQRRAVRRKVKGKKSTLRMYVRITDDNVTVWLLFIRV